VSPISSWFADDFGSTDAAVLQFIAPFASPAAARSMATASAEWTLDYTDYDWSLNDVRER
jgi:hypothetical protein